MIDRFILDQANKLKTSIFAILPDSGMTEQELRALTQSCHLSELVVAAALDALVREGAISIENDMVVPQATVSHL